MITMPSASTKLPAVDEGKLYYHVRMRSPSQFKTCRVPYWAQRASESISKNSKPVMCQKADGTWLLQSVQIKKSSAVNSKRKAKSLGIRIRNKIES